MAVLPQNQGLNDLLVAVEQPANKMGRLLPEDGTGVVEGLEEPVDFLDVEAVVDGLLVRLVLGDVADLDPRYWMRLAIRAMNLFLDSSSDYIINIIYITVCPRATWNPPSCSRSSVRPRPTSR